MEEIAVAVVSNVLSSFIDEAISGKPKAAQLPKQAEVPELPAPGSGGVDTIAAANKRRQTTSRLKSQSGPESTVLSSVGTGGSLGAG